MVICQSVVGKLFLGKPSQTETMQYSWPCVSFSDCSSIAFVGCFPQPHIVLSQQCCKSIQLKTPEGPLLRFPELSMQLCPLCCSFLWTVNQLGLRASAPVTLLRKVTELHLHSCPLTVFENSSRQRAGAVQAHSICSPSPWDHSFALPVFLYLKSRVIYILSDLLNCASRRVNWVPATKTWSKVSLYFIFRRVILKVKQ